jgi:hypothetical protein
VVALPPRTTEVAELVKIVRPFVEVANLSVLDPPALDASRPQYNDPSVVDLTSQFIEVRFSTARLDDVAFVLVELPVIVKLPIFVDEPVEINPPPRVERPDTESVPSVPILVSDVSDVTPGIT